MQNGGDWLPSRGIWKPSQLFPKVDKEEELPELSWVPPNPARPPRDRLGEGTCGTWTVGTGTVTLHNAVPW